VQEFRLDASTGGPVKFHRGSLQPSRFGSNALHWDLANVVTAQRVSMEFPPDSASTQCYLQAVAALPAAFILLLAGAVMAAITDRRAHPAGVVLSALSAISLGLGAAPILANYVGPVASLTAAPLVGALVAASILRGRTLLVVPLSLIPAAFLSPLHSGLIILFLSLVVLAAAWLLRPRFAQLLQPVGNRPGEAAE
jgi:hypothetical protein